jgi:hypothetical protein
MVLKIKRQNCWELKQVRYTTSWKNLVYYNMRSTKLKYSYGLLIFCIALLSGNKLVGQPLTTTEKNYSKLIQNLNTLQAKYDSINILYKDETNRIDVLKRESPDDAKDAMAKAVVLSNELKLISSSIAELKNEISPVKKNLYKLYSANIDSLRSIESSSLSRGEKENLNVEILSLIGKRFSIAGNTEVLSYLPEEMIKIKMNEITDTLQKKIYSEYLLDAISEIDTQLVYTNDQIEKLDEIISIRTKVDEFIEDVDFSNNANRIRSTSTSARTFDEALMGASDKLNDYEFSNQLSNSTKLINQLSLFSSALYQTNQSEISALDMQTLTTEDYRNLMKELDQRLRSYRSALQNNLSAPANE